MPILKMVYSNNYIFIYDYYEKIWLYMLVVFPTLYTALYYFISLRGHQLTPYLSVCKVGSKLSLLMFLQGICSVVVV